MTNIEKAETVKAVVRAASELLSERDMQMLAIRSHVQFAISDLRARSRSTPEQLAEQVPDAVFLERIAKGLESALP